jgi:hypothetical protein
MANEELLPLTRGQQARRANSRFGVPWVALDGSRFKE